MWSRHSDLNRGPAVYEVGRPECSSGVLHCRQGPRTRRWRWCPPSAGGSRRYGQVVCDRLFLAPKKRPHGRTLPCVGQRLCPAGQRRRPEPRLGHPRRYLPDSWRSSSSPSEGSGHAAIDNSGHFAASTLCRLTEGLFGDAGRAVPGSGHAAVQSLSGGTRRPRGRGGTTRRLRKRLCPSRRARTSAGSSGTCGGRQARREGCLAPRRNVGAGTGRPSRRRHLRWDRLLGVEIPSVRYLVSAIVD